MKLFSGLFGTPADKNEPNIQFGRFTDSYKSDEKYASWDTSIELFESEKYIQSYKYFLDFLMVEHANNVTYQQVHGKITFTISQGSKIICGEADHIKFIAEAKIARMNKPNIGLMRILLEENFELKYSRYSIDNENYICLKFDTYVEDGSPHKLYQALKELATVADRRDDVLMQNYEGLEPVNDTHTRQISEKENLLKFDFYKKEISFVLHELDQGKLNAYLYPGGISFLLLDLLYKLDFLIKPEGSIMEKIRDCHDLFFNDNITSIHDKNKEIIREVRTLERVEYPDFKKELYEVNSTFGISIPDSHMRLVEIIDAQLNDIDWYYDNRYHTYAAAICGYVVGFSLYSYSLPEPTKELLKLYYRIVYHEFFENLGFEGGLRIGQTFDKTKIKDCIKHIIKKNREKYNGLKIETSVLEYKDLGTFCRSYLIMLRNIEYPENLS
jgi:integrase